MGLLDRLFGSIGKREGHTVRAAREREEQGDLAGAVQLFVEAGLGDDAARVLLMRADAETSVERRIAFCAQAATRAESDELKRKALGRKALCVFDTLKKSGASFLRTEVLSVAKDLEDAGELERAADAYAMADDVESELRVLTAAGAIDRLEERLRETETATRSQRDSEHRARRFADLDRTAERRAALALADTPPRDPRIEDLARSLRARLARGPTVELEIDGGIRLHALGDDVTIGRADATILVSSRAISRRHVRIFTGPGGPAVEDLGTRNGTWVAGARLGASLPIGDRLEISLGGEVPCVLRPGPDGGVTIEVGGLEYFAPLGPLVIPKTDGMWRVVYTTDETARGSDFVSLWSEGAPQRPVLGELTLADRVELAHGDEIRDVRGGAVRLRVLPPSARPGDVDGERSSAAFP